MIAQETGSARPPRPSDRDPGPREAAIRQILPEVLRWGQGDLEEDRARSDLQACLQRDGYGFARRLQDSFGWNPDAELVEILDNVDLQGAVLDATASWVQDHGITTPHEEGDIVSYKGCDMRVISVRARTAQLLIRDVKDPLPINGLGTIGLIVAAEDVAPVSVLADPA